MSRFMFYEQLVAETPNSKSPETLIHEIDDIIRLVWRSRDDSETLSTELFHLSVLSAGLDNLLETAETNETECKTEYDYLVDKKKLELVSGGESATVAESMAKVELKDKLDELNKWKHNVMVLKRKIRSVEKVLDHGRSRNTTIRSDVKNASF